MAEKGYSLSEEAARRTAEAVRKVEGMLQGRRSHRATGPRGTGGGEGTSAAIIRVTGTGKDGDGYQDGVIGNYQDGAGTAIKVWNFDTSQAALPSGATAFYHAVKLTSDPAGTPSVDVYGLAYTVC